MWMWILTDLDLATSPFVCLTRTIKIERGTYRWSSGEIPREGGRYGYSTLVKR